MGQETTPDQGSEERIARVIENVRVFPELRFDDERHFALDEFRTRFGCPGVSIAVVDGGELAWTRGFGVRDVDSGQPVKTDTLFQAGSISKPVAALGIMRLVADGLLQLDEDVNAYLRTWKVPANDDWQPRLTLRQLLSHTAGLTVHGFPGYPVDDALPTIPQVLDGVAPANTPPVRVNLLPDTRFRYSGGGTTIAQQVMVDVTGVPFPELMRELVFEPLGMNASTYEQPLPEARWEAAATGHLAGGSPVRGRWHVYPEMAAAGLWTTPTDLARAAIGVIRAWHDETNAILPQALIREMLTPIVPAHRGPDGSDSIGIGFFVSGVSSPRRFGHSGSDQGFSSELVAFVGGSWQGAVVMVNGHWAPSAGELIHGLMRSIASEHGWPHDLRHDLPVVDADVSSGMSVAGDYRLPSERVLRLRVQDGQLSLEIEGQPPLPLQPSSTSTWHARAVNADIELLPDESGAIRHLVLRQDGDTQRADRVDRA